MKPRRLDVELVERGLAESRAAGPTAESWRERSGWMVNGGIRQASPVPRPVSIEVRGAERYVGPRRLQARGRAERVFTSTSPACAALDLGARPAASPTACCSTARARSWRSMSATATAWKLRNDPRVKVHEGVNARDLVTYAKEHFPGAFDLVVTDVSFISLRLVLPPAFDLLGYGGRIVALIKPQFEGGPGRGRQGRQSSATRPSARGSCAIWSSGPRPTRWNRRA